jgi:hypothetical protein
MTTGKTLFVIFAYKSNLDWLNGAIYSLTCQTRTNFRCVIADSTPETDPGYAQLSQICNYLRNDPRFIHRHYPWESHGDVTKKANSAVAEFGGDCDYVAFMADDDYVAPRFLEVQAGALDNDPAAGFAQGAVAFFGDNHAFWLTDLPLDLQVADQVGQNQFSGTCVMRLQLFLEFGGYDIDVVPEGFPAGLEDFALFVHFLRTGWRYTVTKEILFFCRQRAEQQSRKLYGTGLYWPLVLKLCQKQGIETIITPEGRLELRYQQVQRTIGP